MEGAKVVPPARRTFSTGWSAIEEYVQKHDSSTVKDHADDIDTLLVFAGLFSAVLTAFVVESYTMLQPDNTQTTNELLAEISSQLRALQVTQPISLTSSFIPSTSARWINALFFLSLVLSLAAALFGILVKQWLREFMRWNSSLASPRENILVRQIRFEAWEEWNVTATISAIPALLELAMMLFLSGIIVLLWTLDSVVAVIITVASVLFLGAVSAFTILPVFFRRCPYKSPTAWACVTLAETLYTIGIGTRHFLTKLAGMDIRNPAIDWDWRIWTAVNTPKVSTDWRERERGFRMSDITHGKTTESEVHRVMEDIIHLEKMGMDESGSLTQEPRRGFARIQLSMDSLKDLNELSILFRALYWVNKDSDDAQIRAHIAEAMDTIHTKQPETLESRAITNTSDWCLIWALQEGDPRHATRAIFPCDGEPAGVTLIRRRVREMWTRERVRTVGDPRVIARIRQRVRFGTVNLQTPDAHTAALLAYLIDSDLLSSLRSLQREVENSHNVIPVTMGRFILELLSVLGCIHSNRHIPISGLQLRGVQYIINSRELKQTLDMRFPGLRSSALLLACRLARVQADDDVFTLVADENRMSSLAYALLVTSYFNSDIEYYDAEDCHILILLATEWILHFHPRSETPASLLLAETVVNKMADVAEYSLRLLTPNCGCYFDLPWIVALWSAREQHFSSSHHAYIRLMHVLGYSHAKRLITGFEERHYRELSILAHEDYPALCEDEECQFYTGTASVSQEA